MGCVDWQGVWVIERFLKESIQKKRKLWKKRLKKDNLLIAFLKKLSPAAQKILIGKILKGEGVWPAVLSVIEEYVEKSVKEQVEEDLVEAYKVLMKGVLEKEFGYGEAILKAVQEYSKRRLKTKLKEGVKEIVKEVVNVEEIKALIEKKLPYEEFKDRIEILRKKAKKELAEKYKDSKRKKLLYLFSIEEAEEHIDKFF